MLCIAAVGPGVRGRECDNSFDFAKGRKEKEKKCIFSHVKKGRDRERNISVGYN